MEEKMTQTFVKITNKDIYKKLEKIEKLAIATNGKVKFHSKLIWGMAGACGTAMLAIIGWIIRILS